MIRAIKILAVAVLLLTTNIISFYLGVDSEADYQAYKKVIRETSEVVKSQGEKATPIYTIEIWDNGDVIVKTTQGYIQQAEDNLLIISDKRWEVTE